MLAIRALLFDSLRDKGSAVEEPQINMLNSAIGDVRKLDSIETAVMDVILT